jgi:hypothetical protein
MYPAPPPRYKLKIIIHLIIFDHIFSRSRREKILVKLTRVPEGLKMNPEVTKTVLNKIILLRFGSKMDRRDIIIWPRDRASISVQQLRINYIHHCFCDPR